MPYQWRDELEIPHWGKTLLPVKNSDLRHKRMTPGPVNQDIDVGIS